MLPNAMGVGLPVDDTRVRKLRSTSCRCRMLILRSSSPRDTNDEVDMRLSPLMLVLATVLISGCASHPIDCSKGVGQNGCVPGTSEYDEMEQKHEETKVTAEIDDARCQAYGARGTPGYIDCRRRAAQDQRLLKRSN